MPQTAANIMAGPARLFLGSTASAVAPVTGTPPTLFQHASGVPSGLQTGFTEIGYTQGPMTFTYKSTKQEINPEQTLAPVDAFVTDEMASLMFNAYERTFVAMSTAFDSVGTVSDATGDLFYAGNGTNLITPKTYIVFASVIHRDNNSKFSWFVLYKAYSMDGVKLPFEKAKPTTYQITLKALADTTRAVGDQVFQAKHEK